MIFSLPPEQAFTTNFLPPDICLLGLLQAILALSMRDISLASGEELQKPVLEEHASKEAADSNKADEPGSTQKAGKTGESNHFVFFSDRI
jgi:hypothetical protein